jgi:hypothetical protein
MPNSRWLPLVSLDFLVCLLSSPFSLLLWFLSSTPSAWAFSASFTFPDSGGRSSAKHLALNHAYPSNSGEHDTWVLEVLHINADFL